MSHNTDPGTKNRKAATKQAKKSNIRAKGTSEQAQQIQAALKLLQPLTEFHKAVEDASQDDLRLSWDVRLVRGKDTPFCHVHGTSSQPAILASNMKANAPSRIQNEVMEKILEPLTSSLQLEVERMTFAELAKRQGEERRPLCGSGDPFAPG